jgi:hypothetical protein
MRFVIISILLLFFYSSCESDNPSADYQISNGTYLGYFIHQNQSYWYSIHFTNGNYFERPSGIERYQKELGCLSIGSYLTEGNTLSFESESSVFSDQRDPCLVDWDLPGTYKIKNTELKDSLIFERGLGENHIAYHLKKMEIE